MAVIRQLTMHEEHRITLSSFIKSPLPKIPAHGYGKHPNDSDKAAAWLLWKSEELGIPLQHSRNGGE